MKELEDLNSKRRWLKKSLIAIVVLVTIFCLLEIFLRTYWGFCDSVLMMENKNYEYIPQPNQDRYRFRNHILYNSFSMRSPEPDTSVYTILGFGDSIINGGVMVEQDSLATTLLSVALTKHLNKKVQVLNIGAGSWGPDNDYGYLLEKGDFKAKMIFLVVSSHDAFDNMDFMPVIDKVRRYESRQYKLATWELIDKYALPRMGNQQSSPETGVIKKGTTFNTGFLNFYKYSLQKGLPFFIYLNPDKTELEAKQYKEEGQQIIAFCKQYNIPLVDGLKTTKPDDYRGVIHMNEQGQRHMAESLLPIMEQLIN